MAGAQLLKEHWILSDSCSTRHFRLAALFEHSAIIVLMGRVKISTNRQTMTVMDCVLLSLLRRCMCAVNTSAMAFNWMRYWIWSGENTQTNCSNDSMDFDGCAWHSACSHSFIALRNCNIDSIWRWWFITFLIFLISQLKKTWFIELNSRRAQRFCLSYHALRLSHVILVFVRQY